MYTAFTLLLLAAFGQFSFYGDIPENVPTFKMTFPNGDVGYGALWLDDAWYMQENVSLPPGKTPTIVFDTPWQPGRDRVLRQPEYVVETISLRKQRLASEWRANGYAPVNTADGERYVLAEELELAKRAHAMEAELLASTATPTPDAEAATGIVPATPSLLERWGLHAIVLALGLGVTLLVFRKMVLSAD